MTELEHRLDELGRAIVFPPTPDLAPLVRARIVRRPWLPRRLLLVVAVMVVAVAGVLAASPGARSAILELLGIGGVTVTRVDELPDVRVRLDASRLGRPVTLEAAERLAPYELRVPPQEEYAEPDAVYHRPRPTGDMVTLVYELGDGRARLLLSQWHGSSEPYFYKLLGPGSTARRVGVGSSPGLWITGRAHAVIAFTYQATDGSHNREEAALAGNVLLWDDGGHSFRLEADVPLAEALEIARSLR